MDNVRLASDLVKLAKNLTARKFDEFPVVELGSIRSNTIDFMTTISPDNKISYPPVEGVVKHFVEKRGEKIRQSLDRNLAELGMRVFDIKVVLEGDKESWWNARIIFSIGYYAPDLRKLKQIALKSLR